MDKEDVKEGGWKPLSAVLGISHPFLEKCLFLEGYDISSNIYVVTGDYLSVIDPGNDYTAFIELFELGYKPTDIKKIVITHGHPEHAMGTFELFRYPSIAQEKNIEILMNEMGPDAFKKLVKEFGCAISPVQNGDILNLSGFDLEVIRTPGHTIDSICLYHAPTRSIFTGDTVLPYAVATPDEIAGGRHDYFLLSLRILRGMEIENLLPGHGMPVAGEAQKVIEGSYAGAIKKIVGLETPWAEAATRMVEKGYLEEGLFCCNKALEEDPENTTVLPLKALCLSDLGRLEEALETYDRVLEEKGKNTFMLTGKGYVLMGLERYEEGLTYLDEALKLNPNFRDAKVYKGVALYLLGRYDEAMDIEEFRTEFVERFKRELEKKRQGVVRKGRL